LKKERKEKSQKWRRKGEANAITINYHQVQNLSSERSKKEETNCLTFVQIKSEMYCAKMRGT
jgi:hypothetical protein